VVHNGYSESIADVLGLEEELYGAILNESFYIKGLGKHTLVFALGSLVLVHHGSSRNHPVATIDLALLFYNHFVSHFCSTNICPLSWSFVPLYVIPNIVVAEELSKELLDPSVALGRDNEDLIKLREGLAGRRLHLNSI